MHSSVDDLFLDMLNLAFDMEDEGVISATDQESIRCCRQWRRAAAKAARIIISNIDILGAIETAAVDVLVRQQRPAFCFPQHEGQSLVPQL